MPPVTDLNLLRHTPAKYQRPDRAAPKTPKHLHVWTLVALFRVFRGTRLRAAKT